MSAGLEVFTWIISGITAARRPHGHMLAYLANLTTYLPSSLCRSCFPESQPVRVFPYVTTHFLTLSPPHPLHFPLAMSHSSLCLISYSSFGTDIFLHQPCPILPSVLSYPSAMSQSCAISPLSRLIHNPGLPHSSLSYSFFCPRSFIHVSFISALS